MLFFNFLEVHGHYLHKGQLSGELFTMFRRKKVSTLTAESRMAFSTSAKLSTSRMEVANPDIDFLSISTSVPNYSARAVISMAAISQSKICPWLA